jgi:hypothetical protein
MGLPPLTRALSLLNEEILSGSGQTPVQLSVGERDALLLSLRQSLFGSHLHSMAECPQCATAVEFTLDADGLRVPLSTDTQSRFTLVQEDISLRYRQVTCADLLALAQYTDSDVARRQLVARCVIEARRGDDVLAPSELPEAVITALSEQLAAHDAQADITLDLTCPECEADWQAPFDIASFVWTEISVRARQLLNEVHTLAWAYGWSEAEILAMSETRRHYYIGQVT